MVLAACLSLFCVLSFARSHNSSRFLLRLLYAICFFCHLHSHGIHCHLISIYRPPTHIESEYQQQQRYQYH